MNDFYSRKAEKLDDLITALMSASLEAGYVRHYEASCASEPDADLIVRMTHIKEILDGWALDLRADLEAVDATANA